MLSAAHVTLVLSAPLPDFHVKVKICFLLAYQRVCDTLQEDDEKAAMAQSLSEMHLGSNDVHSVPKD